MINGNKTDRPAEVQVFELTMDNDEDQDELNRRLRKPGEPDSSKSVKPAKPDFPPTGSTDKSATQS